MILVWHKMLTTAHTRSYPRVSEIQSSSNFGDSCLVLVFETSYVALFNGLMISDIRIFVLHVYCLTF